MSKRELNKSTIDIDSDLITTPKNFETAIEQLENIVNQIDDSDIELDVALSKYQEGMKLVKFCQDKIQDAEQKIKILDLESNTLKDFNLTN